MYLELQRCTEIKYGFQNFDMHCDCTVNAYVRMAASPERKAILLQFLRHFKAPNIKMSTSILHTLLQHGRLKSKYVFKKLVETAAEVCLI
jgi:hypothetical protein